MIRVYEMDKLPQEIWTTLNKMNWRVKDYVDECVEIEMITPSGNSFQLCVCIEHFIEDIISYADKFDLNDYIESELEVRQVDDNGRYEYSAYDIVQDAEIIFHALRALTNALLEDDNADAYSDYFDLPFTEHIQNMLVLHYSHITKETMLDLRCNALQFVISRPINDPRNGNLNGILVIIKDDWEKLSKHLHHSYYEDLCECIKYAKANKCNTIMFTFSADIIDELPTYDQEDDCDLPF